MAISIYKLKPAFISLLRPMAQYIYNKGGTANQVTVAACVMSCILGGILSLGHTIAWLWFTLPIWLFLRMALNAIDGILARECNQKSPLGALLNELGDVVADAALLVPFAFVPGVSAPLAAVCIWLAMLTEFCGVACLLSNGTRVYEGPMGKSDRAFVMGVGGIFMGCGLQYGWSVENWINWVFTVVAFFMCVTVYNRLRAGLKQK